jgi:hypothetical protein
LAFVDAFVKRLLRVKLVGLSKTLFISPTTPSLTAYMVRLRASDEANGSWSRPSWSSTFCTSAVFALNESSIRPPRFEVSLL